MNVDIPRGLAERAEFLRDSLGLDEVAEVVERAIRLLDLTVCAVVIEGGRLLVRGRDGSLQQLDP